jgi:hypothetical protein
VDLDQLAELAIRALHLDTPARAGAGTLFARTRSTARGALDARGIIVDACACGGVELEG